jgi:hypothetical protein
MRILNKIIVAIEFIGASVAYYTDSKLAMLWLCTGLMIMFIEITDIKKNNE